MDAAAGSQRRLHRIAEGGGANIRRAVPDPIDKEVTVE
jgi:hypothetical protein